MPGRATFKIELRAAERSESSVLVNRAFLMVSRVVVGDGLGGWSGVEGLVRDSRTRWNLRFLVSSA